MKKTLLLITLLSVCSVNAQNQLLSSVDQFDTGNVTWENNGGSNYEYDANNNLISTTEYSWDGTSWNESYKDTYTYNTNGKVMTNISQSYDTNTNTFVNDYRSVYTYDGNNNVTEVLEENWNGSQWVNDYKLIFTYTGGNVDVVTGQFWNGTAWENESRSTLTYVNSRLEQFDSAEWDNGAWVPDGRGTYSYDSNGYVSSNVFSTWNGSTYLEDGTSVYTIDGNGNRLTETETFDSQSYISNYTYETSELMSSFANPFADKTGFDYIDEDFPYFNKILSREESFSGNTSSSRTVYNYDNVLSVDSVTAVSELSVYPNPVKNVLNIETLTIIETVEVYNMLGSKVMSSNSTKLNVEQLSVGLYTVKIIDDLGNTTVRKIIKE
jgi:hypothetical protein